MNIYLLFGLLLAAMISIFYLINNKIRSSLKPLPILTHLLSCVILFSLSIFALSIFNVSIPTIAPNSFLSSANQTISSLVLALILIELSHIKPNLKIAKVAGLSFIIPTSAAIGFAFTFGYFSNIQLTASLICIFAISAVPILFLYLKQTNANTETVQLLMGSAIAIDIAAWLIFNLINSTINPFAFVAAIVIAFAPNIVKKYSTGEQRLWVVVLAFIFMMTFSSLFFIKSYALVFGVLFLYNMQQNYPEGFSFLPSHWIMNFFNYFAIPFLLIAALLNISWETLKFNLSLVEFSILIIAPILSKIIGSYLGLWIVKYKGDKLLGSILLNSRGLTEIVFINTVFMIGIITDIMYLSLLIMTFIATIAPGIIIKYQMSKNTKKITRLVRVK